VPGLAEILENAELFDYCMALTVCMESNCVELWLDTELSTYTEWLPGEGSDIGLMRCLETGRVVGIRLPLRRNNLCVHYDGPIRINAGFRKGDTP
jgi:hypothetical protein